MPQIPQLLKLARFADSFAVFRLTLQLLILPLQMLLLKPSSITTPPNGIDRVCLVFDRYPIASLKCQTRTKRLKGTAVRFKVGDDTIIDGEIQSSLLPALGKKMPSCFKVTSFVSIICFRTNEVRNNP